MLENAWVVSTDQSINSEEDMLYIQRWNYFTCGLILSVTQFKAEFIPNPRSTTIISPNFFFLQKQKDEYMQFFLDIADLNEFKKYFCKTLTKSARHEELELVKSVGNFYIFVLPHMQWAKNFRPDPETASLALGPEFY